VIFLSLKIQINHKRSGFGKEKSVENTWSHLKVHHSIQVRGIRMCNLYIVAEISNFAGFNEIYFVSFGLRMWKIPNLK
jgi:hypothetical protein